MPPTPKNPRRVAFMLDLRWALKHHAALFTGTQQYARTQGWESVIDENVADKLPARRTRSMPYDGILCRANRKLVQRAGQLSLLARARHLHGGGPIRRAWLRPHMGEG